jgi:hypothetical protein
MNLFILFVNTIQTLLKNYLNQDLQRFIKQFLIQNHKTQVIFIAFIMMFDQILDMQELEILDVFVI